MKIFFSFALVLITFHAVSIQGPPDTLWTKMFGGEEPGGCEYGGDVGRAVEQTDDMGFIITGWTNSFSHGGSDVWLLATDNNGNEIWSYAFGSQEDEASFDIVKTYDGGYIIAGINSENPWLIRTNELGDTLWTRHYNDSVSYNVQSIREVSENGFILVGTKYTENNDDDIWIARINVDGEILWQDTYGNEYWQNGQSVDETDDGGFIIVGSTHSPAEDTKKILLIKVNEIGDSLWSQSYLAGSWSEGRVVMQMADGGFIIAGAVELWTNSTTEQSLMPSKLKNYLKENNISRDFKKENQTLNLPDSDLKTLPESDLIHYNALTSQGLVIQERDVWLLRTNELGDTLWSKIIGGPGWDDINSIKPTSDNGYVIGGQKYEEKSKSDDFWIIRGNYSGDTLWTTTVGDSADEVAYDIRETINKGYIATGLKHNREVGVDNLWLVRFAETKTDIDISANQIPQKFILKQNYPNPFNPTTTIEYSVKAIDESSQEVNLSIYNILGQKVATLVNKKQPAGHYHVQWDGTGFTSGIYIYRLVAGDFKQSKKMMLVK